MVEWSIPRMGKYNVFELVRECHHPTGQGKATMDGLERLVERGNDI